MSTLLTGHLMVVFLASAVDAALDNPTRPGYTPRGVVVDFAPLPGDVDVSLQFRFTFTGLPADDWPVTTGEPSNGPLIRDRLARILRQDGWDVRELGKTRLEFRTAVVELPGKRKARVPVVDIGISSRRTPPGLLPRVVPPVRKAA
jgi:hypothetical protein